MSSSNRGFAPLVRDVAEMVLSVFGAVGFALWALLTIRKAYEPTEVLTAFGVVTLERDELIVSSRGLAADLGVPEATARRMLKRLADARLILREPIVTQGARRTTLAHPPTRVRVLVGNVSTDSRDEATHVDDAQATHVDDAQATHERSKSDAKEEVIRRKNPPSEDSKKPSAKQLVESLDLDEDLRSWAATKAPNVDVVEELDAFKIRMRSNGFRTNAGPVRDARAAFMTHLRNAERFSAKRGAAGSNSAETMGYTREVWVGLFPGVPYGRTKCGVCDTRHTSDRPAQCAPDREARESR